MKRPSFLAAALLGFALSAALAALTTVFGSILPLGVALRVTIALLAMIYLFVSLGRSQIKIGKAVVLAAWLASAGLLWLLEPPLTVYIGAHVLLIWLVRSLYAYGSLISAGLDLSLCIGSLAGAAWAFERSGSLFLASWCFFLLQALHAAIPPRGLASKAARKPDADSFAKAHRSAEAALRRLAANS